MPWLVHWNPATFGSSLCVPCVLLQIATAYSLVLLFSFLFFVWSLRHVCKRRSISCPFSGPSAGVLYMWIRGPSCLEARMTVHPVRAKRSNPFFNRGLFFFFFKGLCAVRVSFQSFFCICVCAQSSTLPLLLLGLLCGARGNFFTLPRAEVDEHCKDHF